ncbi:hypothetical protein PISL3812_09729 [Talaromyces islandicus]|uniref:CorA-like transporter domain-containing protein n=1 Tax=Talaromyces islandicus TaxID=28573 RepID=A0A0U1MAT4_TALIS|nr:hypothetical protein PISL3812_09729 [Talaromyces islandicus]
MVLEYISTYRLGQETLKNYLERVFECAVIIYVRDDRYVADVPHSLSSATTDATSTGFNATSCNCVQNIKEHFQRTQKDPNVRYVFIHAESSQSPLDCSKDMLDYLLSFHQVSPSFLELVFSFGKETQPDDFHYTSFRQENFLDEADADAFAIRQLGRSGREIRHCYNLWSAERSSFGGKQWPLRNTAVYHSFDVESGKALWINIKANEVIKSRITNATATRSELSADKMSNKSSCFAATLKTHMIHFEWCRENWRPYLSTLEQRLEKILTRVFNAPVELLEAAPPEFIEQVSDISQKGPSRHSTFGQGRLSRQTTGQWRIPESILPAVSENSDTNTQPTITRKTHNAAQLPSISGRHGQFTFLEPFPIEQLQELSRIGSTLQVVGLVIKLNTHVLADIVDYYQCLLTDTRFPASIKNSYSAAISDFIQQSKDIIRDLEREYHRVNTLMQRLNNGKAMFEAILQFRNIETNKLFALNAHHGSQRMEHMTLEMHQSAIEMERMTKSMHKVAEKTERETASMHIITFATLIFLPGTFIATFFGSGLFQWDQNNPGEMPVWKPEFFALFAKICFPFMAGILLIWMGAYWWATKSREPCNKGVAKEV